MPIWIRAKRGRVYSREAVLYGWRPATGLVNRAVSVQSSIEIINPHKPQSRFSIIHCFPAKSRQNPERNKFGNKVGVTLDPSTAYLTPALYTWPQHCILDPSTVYLTAWCLSNCARSLFILSFFLSVYDHVGGVLFMFYLSRDQCL